MTPIDAADQLESDNRWEEAFRLRLARRASSPDDKLALMQLAFQCWYRIVEWPCLPNEGPVSEEVSQVLHECRADLLRKFPHDADVAWLLGYMMSLFAWEFGPDVAAIEAEANDLLERAHVLRPDGPVFILTYLATRFRTDEEYWRACDAARLQLPARFPGIGAMDNYFRQVLDRKKAESP